MRAFGYSTPSNKATFAVLVVSISTSPANPGKMRRVREPIVGSPIVLVGACLVLNRFLIE
jgi:hypothetical protein